MLLRCAISQTPSASVLCHPSHRAGTLPFAVPRLRSPVNHNVHRYDDIDSEFLTVACLTIL